MTRAGLGVLIIGLVGGGLLGEAVWCSAVRERSAAPPPGWVEDGGVPTWRLADPGNALPLSSTHYGLDFWRALTLSPELSTGPSSLSATVQIPDGGQIELWAAADRSEEGVDGVALTLERIGEASATVIQTGRERRRIWCSVSLPAPGDGPVEVAIAPRESGLEVVVDGVSARCTAPVRGAGPAIRSGLRRVLLSDLVVGGQGTPPPGPEWRRAAWVVGALVAGGVVSLELASGLVPALVLLTTAPLLLAGPLAPLDLRLWAETARLVWLPVPWLGALFPAALALMMKGTHHLGRLMREGRPPRGHRDWPMQAVLAAGMPVVLAVTWTPGSAPFGVATISALGVTLTLGFGLIGLLRRLGSARPLRGATLIGVAVSLAGALAVATHGRGPSGLAGAMLAALGLSGLIWVNANAARVRAYNLSCLVAVLALLVGLEGFVRASVAGEAWGGTAGRLQPDDVYGWVPQAREEFAAIEAGQYTTYPDSGYPVAPGARDARLRVVAMGGSTTGGAFQNDDLSEFYPARLGELLGPGVAVLNQGVGGWTTWHIRRYLEAQLDQVAPDVLILYVGHNDLLTPVPAPYSVLYARWRSPGPARAVGDALSGLRLYAALRYLLVSFSPPAQRVAVPLDEARENLGAIVGAVTGRGGKVLLASEGLAPDPGPLLPYNQMMVAMAEANPDVGYEDTASALFDAEGARVFLDDCHLTDAGHRLVAARLAAALQREGMLSPEVGGDEPSP